MKKKKIISIFRLLAFCFVVNQSVFAQQKERLDTDTSLVQFKDTIDVLAFDSATHILPSVTIHQGNFSIVKHFKNIGHHPVFIESTYTTDPHFICNYPQEPIMPGKTYAFKICFTFGSGSAFNYHWRKTMGFVLSDSTRIPLQFEGEVMAK